MRVLLISDFYPPFIGGAEQIIADLASELHSRGHVVTVATLWHQGLEERDHQNGIDIFRLRGGIQQIPFLFTNPVRRAHPPLPDPLVVAQLRRLLAEVRPDVVHGQSWMMLSALPLRRHRRFATVAVLQDYALLCPKKTLLYAEERPCDYGLSWHCLRCAPLTYGLTKGVVTAAGLRLVGQRQYRQVDAFVAISAYVAEAHRRFGPETNAPMVTIPNFIRDSLLDRPVESPLANLPDDYMLFIGALGHHKGIHVLLEAYRSLNTSVPLVLIGTTMPTTPTELPPGVLMLPGLPHHETMRALDHGRFLISPALWPEPFGIVAIEAMARGKAVVASRAGGLLDIVRDGETGLLVEPGNVVELAKAMRTLLDNPGLARRLGAAGFTRCANHFTAHAVVPRLVDVYDRAFAHARGTAVWEAV